MIRRGAALGGGLLVLILLVLGVKGCLNARKERSLKDYARNVTQIVDETNQTSKAFFERLSNPEDLSVKEFTTEVSADRSAMDTYATRVDGLDTPGDMSHAQQSLELVYELRSAAMGEIADNMSTALGDIGSEHAIAVIAKQMQMLMASDVVYASVARPEINAVLAANGIEGDDVPKSAIVPDGTQWLEESSISSALALVNGASASETEGVHGLGLISTGINGTTLVADSTTAVAGEETPEVEVSVQNQGESTENAITVSVTVNGGSTLQQDISSIEPGETQSVSIPLTPAPTGQATLEVNVQTVPGEQVADNNKASYTVEFE
jgi:hypothetical protein